MKRKYPVGIQSFEKLRKDGYLYIDKTALIYKLMTEGGSYFLSRPRRFGKSLLVSTLAAVFEGRRELFEAFTTDEGTEQPQLFIATTNWKWEKHPVIRFDFSQTNLKYFVKLEEYIMQTLQLFEERYGLTQMVKSHSLAEAIRCAHEKTGHRAVVLVDEYDTLMLHSIGNAEQMEYVRDTFSALFGPLKGLDDHLQFVFITGISKFSQMGVFS
ncbi:MAG: AAA family ATPase, partial [Prevotella sp.]|nr:AAA family ATPase [Prevotella sp.]